MKNLENHLGKRNSTNENIERAFIILVDEKITLVEKKSQYQSNKKKETATQQRKKHLIKVMIQLECILEKWVELSFFLEKVKLL